jgi:flagellar biosynthetic protein FliR
MNVEIVGFSLILIRLSCIVMTAPVFGYKGLPLILKISLSGLLALVLFPILEKQIPTDLQTVPFDVWEISIAISREILVGIIIGFMSNLVFWAISMAISLASLHMGFQTASLFNPFAEVTTSAVEQFSSILALGFFLSINGHHLLLQALKHSFTVVPIGTFVINELTAEYLVNISGNLFLTAVQFSMPIMGVLLLMDIGMGLVARAVPQIQVFFLGLPLKIGVGLLSFALSLTFILPSLDNLTVRMVDSIIQLISTN